MTYNCLIADDNEIERDLIAMFIEKIPMLKVVGVCADGTEAAAMISTQDIDIVITDIDMPHLTGTGLLKSLKNPPAFIFITSFKDYAVESFDLDVIDFLVKPVNFERFLKAINKTTDYLKLKSNSSTEQSPDQAVSEKQDDEFFIKESSGITKLKYADVVFIESVGDFSKIHTVQNQTHMVLTSLKNFELQIPATIFKRIHKQYIINLNHIVTLTNTHVHLTGKRTVSLSSSYRQPLLDTFVSKGVIKRNLK